MFSVFCTHFPAFPFENCIEHKNFHSLFLASSLISAPVCSPLFSIRLSLSPTSVVVGFISFRVSFQFFFSFFFFFAFMADLASCCTSLQLQLCICVYLYLPYIIHMYMYVCYIYSIPFHFPHSFDFKLCNFHPRVDNKSAKRQTNLQLKLFNYPAIQILKHIHTYIYIICIFS